MAATLCLEQGAGLSERIEGPVAFEAELRWDAPDRARFRVPGGRGEVALERLEARVRLQIELSNARTAIDTALRMLLGLLLPVHGGLLVHASAVSMGERAYVFLGASGAGKTTTARRLASEGAYLLAEDLLVLRSSGGGSAEACRFDSAFRPGAERGAEFPVAGAYLVYKGAESTEVCAPRTAPLQAWSSAIFSPLVSPAWTEMFVEALSALYGIPLRGFAAARFGPLRPAFEEPKGEAR